MSAYLIRRLLLIIPTFFFITLTIFFLLRLIPGSVIDQMLAEMAGFARGGTLTHADVAAALGLDVPIHIQYLRWMGGLLRGDLGLSLWSNIPVIEEIAARIPVSVELGLLGLTTAMLIALPIGIYSAIRQDTVGDYIGRTVAILAISVPGFWIGTMVVVYPSIWLGWSPPVEYIPFLKDPLANLSQFIVPAVIMGMVTSGATMRMTRTMMLEVLRQDYIRTAWSKGLTERVVILRHALKNALIPVVTLVGMLLPWLIAGSVIMETIFCLPGIGLMVIEALNKRDYPVVSGINLFVASLILILNLVVDISYAYLDPRVQYR